MKKIKCLIAAFLSNYFLLLSKITRRKKNHITSDKEQTTAYCTGILREAGYKFPKLFEKPLPPLKPVSCDLSIIIPVYNDEKYLSRCLDSVFANKTEFSFEVICVNDGSTDKSPDILDSYCKKFDNLIVINQKNAGIASARNTGISMAGGEYLSFIDDDDAVSNNYIDTLLYCAHQDNADIVQGRSEKISDKLYIREDDYQNKYQKFSGFVWGGCIRKSLFNTIRFPDGFWYEDMISRMALMHISKLSVILPSSIYTKYEHNHNASLTLWKSGDIKSLDQFWLAKSLTEHLTRSCNIQITPALSSQLMHEWSTYLYLRTAGLPRKVRKAMFMLASMYFIEINNSVPVLDLLKKDKFGQGFYEALSSGNFLYWKFTCLADRFNDSMKNNK